MAISPTLLALTLPRGFQLISTPCKVFERERLVHTLLQSALPKSIFSCIVYWMIGLRRAASNFLIFLGSMELCVFASN
jgi:hypothetical protein